VHARGKAYNARIVVFAGGARNADCCHQTINLNYLGGGENISAHSHMRVRRRRAAHAP
jgi:hypothetical protein